jgi:fructokinase
MSQVVAGLVQVAGNAVLDVLVRDVAQASGPAKDAWGSNVQLVQRPIEGVLGGCGAAVAYVLGRLGQRVVLNANLGRDPWGELLRGWLAMAGVELCGEPQAGTAVHVIALNAEGGRHSLYYAGEKVRWERSLEAETPEWFLASGYGKVDAEDVESLRLVFAEMRSRGAKVAFDPSPWFAGRVEREAMRALWKEVDCLLGTEEELGFWERAEGLEELMARLLERGPESTVVKRGGEGAAYAARKGERGRVVVERVERANTVGAGDSFNGRLLYGLCRGESLGEAVSEAARLATRVVQQGRGVLGALEGFPDNQ